MYTWEMTEAFADRNSSANWRNPQETVQFHIDQFFRQHRFLKLAMI